MIGSASWPLWVSLRDRTRLVWRGSLFWGNRSVGCPYLPWVFFVAIHVFIWVKGQELFWSLRGCWDGIVCHRPCEFNDGVLGWLVKRLDGARLFFYQDWPDFYTGLAAAL